MPLQAPSSPSLLSCPNCSKDFIVPQRLPINLGSGHTICSVCVVHLKNRQCPFDQEVIATDVPLNTAILQSIDTTEGAESLLKQTQRSVRNLSQTDLRCYRIAKQCIKDLASNLPSSGKYQESPLSNAMHRKLVTLINCQLMEEEGRVRALRAVRLVGERLVTELIIRHQKPSELKINLLVALRWRGCQFLGPNIQEKVLNILLQALEGGEAMTRRKLVAFIVQRLSPQFLDISNTNVGHISQLLYRGSCFNVTKCRADYSLLQLKEEFRTYEPLRRAHDAQIIQIATEVGLRMAPDQWSKFLYGDSMHKSEMQSIIDSLHNPRSFASSVHELSIALQQINDPPDLEYLLTHLKNLALIDSSLEYPSTWEVLSKALQLLRQVVNCYVELIQQHNNRNLSDVSVLQESLSNRRYKTSHCRNLSVRGFCHRGAGCKYAHSDEELEYFRAKSENNNMNTATPANSVFSSLAEQALPLNVAPIVQPTPSQQTNILSINSSIQCQQQTPKAELYEEIKPATETPAISNDIEHSSQFSRNGNFSKAPDNANRALDTQTNSHDFWNISAKLRHDNSYWFGGADIEHFYSEYNSAQGTWNDGINTSLNGASTLANSNSSLNSAKTVGFERNVINAHYEPFRSYFDMKSLSIQDDK